MIDLPIGKTAHVYNVGAIMCVKDDSTYTCRYCVLRGTSNCRNFECRDSYRSDNNDVHFVKVKGCSLPMLISILRDLFRKTQK